MKILLINPPFRCFTGFYLFGFPLGLSILAAIAQEEGIEAAVCEIDRFVPTDDLNFSNEHAGLNKYISCVNNLGHPAWEEIRRLLLLHKPDVVGITAYTMSFASALRTAEICKKYNPSVVTIFGGPHPTARPQDCFNSDYVDYVVVGEGENAFRQLLRFLSGRSGGPETIPGIGYRQQGEVRINPQADFIEDLDSIPVPCRELLWYKDKYSSVDMGMIIISRGCPFDCTYCFHFWGKKVRYRSVSHILNEIEQVKNKYGTTHFSFKDDMMTLNRKLVLELCDEIKNRNVHFTWECTTRADVLDEILLDRMIAAGCNTIKIGVESGSSRILEKTKKNTTKEALTRTARLLGSRNIFWSAYFMYGLPFETEDDLQSTYAFLKELRPDYAALGLYQISPTTELYEYGVEQGMYYRQIELGYFFKVNPKDYYIINPDKRTLSIEPERFKALERFLNQEFDNYNTSYARLFRRGWARRHTYLKDPLFLCKEVTMALKWIVNNRLNRSKRRAR